MLVEHFRLLRKVVRTFDKVVQLFTPLKQVFDGLMQDCSRIIKIILNLGYLVIYRWILGVCGGV